jgi:transposase-like protein
MVYLKTIFCPHCKESKPREKFDYSFVMKVWICKDCGGEF